MTEILNGSAKPLDFESNAQRHIRADYESNAY
jgi:hypothetical protein